MGLNAQTTVPTFTTGQVLTATEMNQSARTGVPVFADTTARDAGFGGTGEKTLAEGQLCYLESTNVVQYYDGSVWATVGPSAESGLTLISSTTIGTTVSSVTVSNAFSATYDSYRIILGQGTSSAGGTLGLTLGATATGYYSGYVGRQWAGTTVAGQVSNGTSWNAGIHVSAGLSMVVDLINPYLTDETYFVGFTVGIDTGSEARYQGGFLNNTTSYTAFTLTPQSGTLTGGTIKVYGYKN